MPNSYRTGHKVGRTLYIDDKIVGLVDTPEIADAIVFAVHREPLVYVAGPYTNPDPVTNTRAAVEIGLDIYRHSGVGVVIPHLSLLAHAMFPQALGWWYDFDLAQLAACTALLRLPGESDGADREVRAAHQLGLAVFDDVRELYAHLGHVNPLM